MAEIPATDIMPAREQAAFRAAYAAFRSATDPQDERTLRKLAVVVVSALDAGWSRRSIAEGLGINREKVARLALLQDVPRIKVDPFAPGTEFPAKATAAYRRYEDEVNLRRILTERTFAGAVRAANAAGWSNPRLGAIIGLTGERMRQIAEMHLSSDGVSIPCFTPYAKSPKPKPGKRRERPSLSAEEKAEMRRLAEAAKKATRRVGRRLGPAPSAEEVKELRDALAARKASEELSDLIIAGRNRGVPWTDLDDACGYARGSAQVRAVRHGYGQGWSSLPVYTPTELDGSVQETLAAVQGGA